MRALGRRSGGDGAGDTAAETAASGPEAEDMLDLSDGWVAEDEAAEAFSPPASGRIAAVAAGLAIAAWTGFFAWAHALTIRAGATPVQWADWIVQWAVPVGLIGIVWLLAMRTSQAESRRFGAVAAQMNREGAALEARLKVVNRELSLAREFLAAEARDLETLGRLAAERLSTHAAALQGLIVSNGAQVEAIGSASETALGNMNRLRDDLPVIANAARDVANQIGSAGRTAEDQLATLTDGLDRLGRAGSDTEARVARLSADVSGTLDRFESQLASIGALLGERFVALQGQSEDWRARLNALEDEALAAQAERANAAALETETIAARLRDTGDAAAARIAHLRGEVQHLEDMLAERQRQFDEAAERRRAAIETHEAQASEVLAQRLAALDDTLAERREAQLAEVQKLAAEGEAMARRMAELEMLIVTITATSASARETLGQGLATLGGQLDEKRAALAVTEGQIGQLTDSSVRLLEILQSGTRTCRDDLAAAIGGANTALEGVEARADKVGALMLRSTQAGSDLSAYLLQTRAEIDAAEIAIAGFKTRLADESEDALARLQGLRGAFARLSEESAGVAGESLEALRDALGAVEAAIARAFATLDDGARDKARVLAERIGGEAVEALERSLRNESAATIGKLEQAAAHAAGVGREAAVQLRDQLVKVNELTGNLEQRVTRARELAEEQVNNDFARRMALITDSLNSAAIDISGALLSEVADTAWDAYLKGDRGIFTRRAVRLIDNGTVRDIVALYSGDEAFKANVNRYIHDFEALLRQTLSTRDGHVLSVTMLGSDMGKLYVALAQAIQRFRT